VHLYEHQQQIEATTAYYLVIASKACQISEVKEWRHGSFNVCIPVDISDGHSDGHYTGKRVLIRFPLPYKVGESRYPGNADEKLRCEIAAYIWINQNCPSLPIPKLLGFTFYNNRTVSCFGPWLNVRLIHRLSSCSPKAHLSSNDLSGMLGVFYLLYLARLCLATM
jgi:hypothetical protein